jgi:hypothetical protein
MSSSFSLDAYVSVLSFLYSQPALYTGYIIHPASLLIPTSERIICQQHGSVQVDNLLLLVFGVAFLAFARPDEQNLGEKGSIHVAISHE